MWFQQELEFVSYASAVFATLRRAMGISESDFLQSVAPENLPYLEFISNSKSGQDFYISWVQTEENHFFSQLEFILRRGLIDLWRGLLSNIIMIL